MCSTIIVEGFRAKKILIQRFLHWSGNFWAKKIPASTGGEAKDFSGFCAGFSDRPKKNHKAIIILLTEDFSMVWRKRQNKNGKRLRFPCRNSPTLECAVPSSWKASGQKKILIQRFLHWSGNFWAKKIPASNYSPTLKCAVPSSLGPLSIVFGMGTWVSSLL